MEPSCNKLEHGPFSVMSGAPWNVLDSRGVRIALCGGDSNADCERFGPPIAAAIVEALNDKQMAERERDEAILRLSEARQLFDFPPKYKSRMNLLMTVKEILCGESLPEDSRDVELNRLYSQTEQLQSECDQLAGRVKMLENLSESAVVALHMHSHAGINKPGFDECRVGLCRAWHALAAKGGAGESA